jgi:hypothetical protein
MNREKNTMHIYEIFLYTVHDDGLPGFHSIPKSNVNLVSTSVTMTAKGELHALDAFIDTQ